MSGGIVFPMNRGELKTLGWERPDFVLVTGDAFIDHSSYGAAIIARVLAIRGYRVGVISQPDWTGLDDIMALGCPRLAFLVTSGNLDSMVNHYTVGGKRRHKDVYSPGGEGGLRPNRAVITYCALIREAYGDAPVIIGGIEASLRRFAHYDYWQDKVRRSILIDSQADLLVYGMGEKAIAEVAEALDSGLAIRDLTYIRGTAWVSQAKPEGGISLPSFEDVSQDKRDFARAAAMIQGSNDPFYDHAFIQETDGRYLVQNPAQMPLTPLEMDDIYALPYTRRQLGGGAPAPSFEEVAFSVTANRGCLGSCAFCALAVHQGRYIQRRSQESILKEIGEMTQLPDFKGYIHDIGGPTANFLNPACKKQQEKGVCRNRECLYPTICPNLDCDESDYCEILRAARKVPGVKKVFVRSGVRYDFLLADKHSQLFKELVAWHVSGQLRVAPEHSSDAVLAVMRKPPIAVYERFTKEFEKIDKSHGGKQYVVPYFISSHPGSTLKDAVALSEFFHKHHVIPEQVQDFYPTPGSLATAMYYTGLDPQTLKPVYVAKGREKKLQRALLQFNDPKNRALVEEALKKAHRTDLIGSGPDALIRRAAAKPQASDAKKKERNHGKNRKKTRR